jgi:hypothetical protein
LSNHEQHSNGIGNQNDLVGRFFQDHPSAMIGWLNTPHPARAQKLLNVFHKDRLKYSVRCTATPQLQREHRMLNTSMGTTFVENNPSLQNAKEIYSAVRGKQITADTTRKLLQVAIRPAEAILPAWHFLARGRSFSPGARIQIGLTSEQEPNAESRVLLSEKTDALGIPRSNIRWKLTDQTLRTMRKFAKVLQEEFARAGIGQIDLED